MATLSSVKMLNGSPPLAVVTSAAKSEVDEALGFKMFGAPKQLWTQAEDEKLRKLVEERGEGTWTDIAALLGGRVGKQCRDRWRNHLCPDIKKGAWSAEEDALLFKFQAKYGHSWSDIARQIPGRTDLSVKNRWYSYKRKQSRREAREKAVSQVSSKMHSVGTSSSDLKRSISKVACVTPVMHSGAGKASQQVDPAGKKKRRLLAPESSPACVSPSRFLSTPEGASFQVLMQREREIQSLRSERDALRQERDTLRTLVSTLVDNKTLKTMGLAQLVPQARAVPVDKEACQAQRIEALEKKLEALLNHQQQQQQSPQKQDSVASMSPHTIARNIGLFENLNRQKNKAATLAEQGAGCVQKNGAANLLLHLARVCSSESLIKVPKFHLSGDIGGMSPQAENKRVDATSTWSTATPDH